MLVISSATLKAHILPYGAVLSGLWHDGVNHSLVLGSEDASAYAGELTYFGAVIGPVANRLSGASVSINGADHALEANEGRNCLHSGSEGTHARTWDVKHHLSNDVLLAVTLPDGAAGLPGIRDITARYVLTDDAKMHLTLTAQSDADTVMNLAHHPYWNLDGTASIAGHRLQVCADHYLPVDAKLLPSGDIAAVDGTRHDFRISRLVQTDMTLDENYCLSQSPSPTPAHAASLIGSNGLALDIETTEPGLQMYNGSGLTKTTAHPHDGRTLGPFAGIALEPQRWPDAARHGHFPSILLRAGEVYYQETVYRFGTQLS